MGSGKPYWLNRYDSQSQVLNLCNYNINSDLMGLNGDDLRNILGSKYLDCQNVKAIDLRILFLKLGCNMIGDQGCRYLGEANLPSLEKLSLRKVFII